MGRRDIAEQRRGETMPQDGVREALAV